VTTPRRKSESLQLRSSAVFGRELSRFAQIAEARNAPLPTDNPPPRSGVKKPRAYKPPDHANT
jgi:hypothetical protein